MHGSSVSCSGVSATETPSIADTRYSSVSCSDVSATVTPSIADTGYAVAAMSDPRYAVANPMPVARVAIAVSRGITVAVSRGIGIIIIVIVAVGRGITVAVGWGITVAVGWGGNGGTDESARGKPDAGTTPTAMTETAAMETKRPSLSGR